MYLKSLKVAEFAGLAKAELDALEPGLNVIVGNNEAGKSTLLKALRAAFFQKHRAKGEAIEALLPYGSQGRPTVAVSFALNGDDYTLTKSFMQRPAAELSGPWPGAMSGDAVEEKLAELLGFIHPGRGDSKLAEHQGAFGLLWVEQGRSNAGLDIGAGRDAVTASLEGEVGTILGGDRGRALIAAAKRLQDTYYTDKGRLALRSPLRDAEEKLSAACEALAQKQAAWGDLEQKLKRLEERRRTLKGYEDAGTVAKAEAALGAAIEAVRRAGERDRDWQVASQALKHAEAVQAGAAEALARRNAQIAAKDAANSKAEAAVRDFAEIDAEARDVAARTAAALEGHRRAQAELRLAESRHEADRRRNEIVRDETMLETLLKSVEAAESLGEAIEAVERQLDAIRVDAAALAVIRKAAAAKRDCEVRLSVAAPSVTFEPDVGGTIETEGGASFAAGESHRVSEPTRFLLGGFGALTIEPGGNAEKLGADLKAAAEALRDRLAKHGVASEDAARIAVERAGELRSELASLTARRETLVPNGLDEARIRLRSAEASVARLRAASDEDAAILAGIEGVSSQELRQAMEAARRQHDISARSFEEAREQSEAATLRRASAESEAMHLRGLAERLTAETEAAETTLPRQKLLEARAEADADCEAKAALLALRERERALDDPLLAERGRADAETALSRIQETVRQLREDAVGLEGEVRVAGGSGLGEAIALLEGEAETLERRCERLKLEAEAARLLYTTLLEAQRSAREHWLGPIKTRVEPYLRLIHPEADIDLHEETLELKGLRRAGVDERFDRLSSGAREQVAVVTRIALAHVLKSGGHPATVILDDALVNTDEERLERMHQVLREAARELQIIVLTCRERDFRDLGAPIFRL